MVDEIHQIRVVVDTSTGRPTYAYVKCDLTYPEYNDPKSKKKLIELKKPKVVVTLGIGGMSDDQIRQFVGIWLQHFNAYVSGQGIGVSTLPSLHLIPMPPLPPPHTPSLD